MRIAVNKKSNIIYIYIYITIKISFQNNQPLRINEGRHSFAGSESIGKGILDGVNTLIYTILKHFVGTPSNISSQISDYILHYCLLGWFYFAYFIFNIILCASAFSDVFRLPLQYQSLIRLPILSLCNRYMVKRGSLVAGAGTEKCQACMLWQVRGVAEVVTIRIACVLLDALPLKAGPSTARLRAFSKHKQLGDWSPGQGMRGIGLVRVCVTKCNGVKKNLIIEC